MSKATLVSSIDLDKIHHHRQSRLDEKNVEQHLEWAVIFVNYADHDWARILFVEVRRRVRRLMRQRYLDDEELCSRD
jgi:hypothetical protein